MNVTPDESDAVVRTLPLVVEGPDGAIIPALSLVALSRLEQLDGPVILRGDGVQVGGRLIPTDNRARLEVNYTADLRLGARPATPTYWSASDVLAGRLAPGALAGRVVLVGATDPALGDSQVTPVDKGGRTPGVFIHANALNTLLTRSYLVPGGRLRTLAWAFAVALAAALAVLSLPLWAAVPATLVAVATHVVIGSASFDGGVVVDLVYPTLAGLAGFVVALGLRYVGEAGARRRMGEVLTQYVPPAVAAQLLDRDGGGALPSGTITFLFSDVVGSTALWESSPKEMSRAMRLHDALVEAAVQASGGALVRPRGEGTRVSRCSSTRLRRCGRRPTSPAPWPRRTGPRRCRSGSAWPCTPARRSSGRGTITAPRPTAAPASGPSPSRGRSSSRPPRPRPWAPTSPRAPHCGLWGRSA